MTPAARAFTAALLVNVLNTIYVSWRYFALHLGWAEPGTGLCSFSEFVDCDAVLLTREARAFFVPNATLGLAFYGGCLIAWLGSRRLEPSARALMTRILVLWLGVATLMTLYFLYLMSGLDHLCPVCPWSHLGCWASLAAGLAIQRQGPGAPITWAGVRPLLPLGGLCVGQALVWQLAWFVPFQAGVMTP